MVKVKKIIVSGTEKQSYAFDFVDDLRGQKYN